MIRAALFGLALSGISSSAIALSCMAPDVTAAFRAAQEAPERYIVAIGTLRFDQAQLPRTMGNDSPLITRIPARLTGQALTETGFDFRFDRAITLEVQCWGPWCGGAGPHTRYLAFLREGEGGYVMQADPCGSVLFQEPTEEMRDKVARCFREGRCPAP